MVSGQWSVTVLSMPTVGMVLEPLLLITAHCPLITIIWLGAVGGIIGSFLNVVVYRVPAGMSLLRPGSHCPHCGHAVRWYHNVPVLGWFLLSGRCHDCKAPISPQYPLVEGATAAMFAIVGIGHPFGSIVALSIYTFHQFLLCTLLVIMLIERAGKPVPKKQERQNFLLAAVLTGVFLGWQAALIITPICLVAYLSWKALHWFMPHGALLPPSVMWLVSALVWILLLPM